MANYATLKAAIQAAIHDNGNSEITGLLLQNALLSMVNGLGANYQFAGVASPSVNPGTPDENVAYLCGPGTYPNMGNNTIPDGSIGIIKYNGAWTVDSVIVGKDYDGYFGIKYGSVINASSTQNGKMIGRNGNFENNAYYVLKSFSVTGGKSYLINGIEIGNIYTCGWVAYSGSTKLVFGANNNGSTMAVARMPEDANILYVCQPTYGNLPAITVKETTSVIDEIFAQLESIENSIGGDGNGLDNIDVANYALLIEETYVNKVWVNDSLIDDPFSQRNATSLVPIDKTKLIAPGTVGYTEVVLFDANKNYLSTVNAYIDEPILAANIPANAVYMAFNYYRNSLAAEDSVFYVSTRDYYKRLTTKLYATKNKQKWTRPKVYIYTSDSQETIFKKMVDAFYIQDCDVIFEHGNYSFDSIFYLLRNKYNWGDAFELPIGGNCHYYFNNSTFTGGYGSQTPSANLLVETNSAIFGTHRLDGQDYELHDGELIANGLVYCVHDEAQGGAESYVHKYENMIMRYNTGQYTQYASKCIGGGTGLAGEVVLNNCKFYNDNSAEDVSWHGHSLTTASVFKLFISNCFFVNGIGLHNLAANETGYLFLSSSLIQTVPSGTRWTVFSTV